MSPSTSRLTARLGAGLGTTVLLLTAACGGATVNDAPPAAAGSGSAASCGTVDLAMSDWVGYTANAAVVTYVAETRLGCKIAPKALKEEIAWQGFASGQVDVILENWGHADLAKKYIDQQAVAVDAGPTGNTGQIGWYVPPWLAAEHPDILDWENLNTYAERFKTSESGDKGQLLDGDPSFVTNDEALVSNLDLDYEVVYAGSEAALIQSFRDAEKNRKWLLGYFYSPQWFLAEVPLEKVALPPYTDGCDADPEKVACDYPDYALNKVLATEFADSGSPAVGLVRNFTWTNEDQNLVAQYITADKMTPEEAARTWVEANPDKVEAWLAP